MAENWSELKTQTLSKEEVEALLSTEFGDKINPVKPHELAKKHRSEAIRRSAKTIWPADK